MYGSDGRTATLSRWQALFYLLVAFAMCTVFTSLLLSHQFLRIYTASLAANQAWAQRLQGCAELGKLAAAVNAPGNDVFQSQKADAESARMQSSRRQFEERIALFQSEIESNVDPAEAAPLLRGLLGARHALEEMFAEARRLFAHFKNGSTREAGTSMAAMDRRFLSVIESLESLRGDIAAIQGRAFEKQADAAASLQRLEYGVDALVLAMILAAMFYAHKVRKQMEHATREKERLIAELRRSEAELDGRVRDRTFELVEAGQVQRQLLKQLMSAQEDERRRIARDLHDEIGQSLTSLLFGLRSLAESDAASARERIEDLRSIVVATLDQVRCLARGLRPSVLDDLGLTAALERQAADFSDVHGIPVKIECRGDLARRLPGEVETALYRIAQEALTNSARHAQAHHVHMTLDQQPHEVRLTVADDGRGFANKDSRIGRGLGLSGMRERAALLKGMVRIDSKPGDGTRITVQIPVKDSSHE